VLLADDGLAAVNSQQLTTTTTFLRTRLALMSRSGELEL